MEKSDFHVANERLEQLKSEFQVDVLTGWGESGLGDSGAPGTGTWSIPELERLHSTLRLFADAMGGAASFVNNLSGVTVRKADIGSHGGEALSHRVSFSEKGSFGAWTVIHEFAHAWDANHGWKLSIALEQYTGGYTSLIRSLITKIFGNADSGIWSNEDKPGRRGRKPGCNAAGYFYGDKPSGSNWTFNRVEDFAESVAMYIGWEGKNDLSDHARHRITRYLLADGEQDELFGTKDNWTVYARYFYPEGGDYSKTLRWEFVDGLMKRKV